MSFNIEEFGDKVVSDLKDATFKLRRLKVKAVAKAALLTVVIIGGTTATVLVPNPITAGLVIGVASALAGGEGIKNTVQRARKVSKQKRDIKVVKKQTDEQIFMNKVKSQVGVDPSKPSAPSRELALYPVLPV